MKKKISDILLSLLLFIIGICLLFWSDEVIKAVSILLGSLFILYGVMTIIKYFKTEPRSVLLISIGIISIVIGIILLFRKNIITETISFIVGIFIIISSIGSLTNAIEQKSKNYMIGIGLSVTGIIIGVLCVLGKILIPNIILEFMGVLLIIYSVTSVINTIVISSK